MSQYTVTDQFDSNTFSNTNDSSSSSSSSSGGRNKFREALMAASKYKSQTDYKAEKEAEEKEKKAAQRTTMKISDDASVMEGYTDPGFTLTRSERYIFTRNSRSCNHTICSFNWSGNRSSW